MNNEQLTMIRPLIECTRAQIEEYCRENFLEYRTDSTNTDTKYRRNHIRHEVLPLLGWNPEHLRRMFRALEEDEALLSRQAQALGRDEMLSAPEPLKNRALREMLVEQGREPSSARMRELEKNLTVGACKPPEITNETKSFTIQHLPEDFTKNLPEMRKEDLANCLDYDTIVNGAVSGRRQPGDAMRLCNGAGTKPVKKLCQERGIPPAAREGLAMLRDGAGLVWVEGMGCAHRCRITVNTKRAIRVITHPLSPVVTSPSEEGDCDSLYESFE